MKTSTQNPAQLASHVLGLAEAAEKLCEGFSQEMQGLEPLEAVLLTLREQAQELAYIVPDPEIEVLRQDKLGTTSHH